MRHHPQGSVSAALHPDLADALAQARQWRWRDIRTWARVVDAKVALLNDYLGQHELDSCVVPVSGGLDSAVVLGLVARAAAAPGSPIRRIVPLLLPVPSVGATNQDVATQRGRAVCAAFAVEPAVAQLSDPLGALRTRVDGAVGSSGDAWAIGQLVSYLRTPALYYAASLLIQHGRRPIVIGTTNLDEGGYLGFFGKASDAMVDVQLISDLHKSEVCALGRELGVPADVLAAAPTGDMFDGRTDEQVFGAPYDFVELFLTYRCHRPQVADEWSEQARDQYARLSENLQELHRHNAHKYLVFSPAVHLDVLPSAVPGGWRYACWPDHPRAALRQPAQP